MVSPLFLIDIIVRFCYNNDSFYNVLFYIMGGSMEKIKRLCDDIRRDARDGRIDPEKVDAITSLIKTQTDENKRLIAGDLLSELGVIDEIRIWLYSLALKIYPDIEVFKRWITYIGMLPNLDYKKKYFLFRQISSMIFRHPIYNVEDGVSAAWLLLDRIVCECKQKLGLKLEEIPVSERHRDISVVLVEQFLSDEHGPTKTALDRCLVLKKQFGQNVILINTAEMLAPANVVYIEDIGVGNYFEQLTNQNMVSWKGEDINFYQCAQNMPSDSGLLELVEFIREVKPSSIVLVGGSSLVAGLLDDMIPVITVGTIQSGLAITPTRYQIVDQNMLEKGYSLLACMGKDKEHIIPGKFTFSLKPQTNVISRKELGIDENQFALAVVGGRLTDEMTDEFMNMLEECVTDDMVVGVIGRCQDYDDKRKRHPLLEGHMIYLGFVSDILSVVEHFDLYVNPIRRGGGTSAIEAMSKGLPVVSVDYGDVAGIVGSDFTCKDYAEMKVCIERYKNDTAFYHEKSQLALKLAKEYMDSEKEFSNIMESYYKRQGYQVAKQNIDGKAISKKRTLKIALLHGAENNAGDFLIRNRSRALIMHYYPDCELTEYYRNRRFSDAVLEEISRNDIAILAGGPACYNGFYPVMEQLMRLNIPLFALGLGWFGYDECSNAVYNDILDEKMIHALKRLELTSGVIGCRDFNTVHVLRNCGIRRTMMTGCPAWYNIDKVGQTHYEGPTLKECSKICISDCGDANHLQSLLEVLVMARDFFGPDKSIYFVTHKPDAQLYLSTISDLLEEKNIRHIDISGSGDGFKVYDDCDVHIGFRVHAHIYMLSERKLSILVEEDARGGGVNSALGLPNIRAFWSTVGDNQLQHINNTFLVRELRDYLFDLHENNYIQMDQAYMMMKRYFNNMETHIKSIEKRV